LTVAIYGRQAQVELIKMQAMTRPYFIPKNEAARRASVLARPTLASGLVCLMLALVTLLAYLPVRHHGFVVYDDPVYVTGNRPVQAGLTWAGAKWAFTTFYSSNWHPLTWFSHMLDVQLFGASPTGPHMVNVLFHAANTVLLFILLRRLTGALWRSALVAALFALHPLHVESVAWVAERKDVLSAFFFLLTLLMYARYVEKRSRVEDRGSRSATASALNSRLAARAYCAVLIFFALGLMSKPMLVTLPFVLLLLDYWPLRRLAIGDWRLAIRLIREKVPLFLLSALSSVVTFAAQKSGGTVRSLASFPMGERIENALVSYARYLGKTFWPDDLAAYYPHPGYWPAWQVVSAVMLVAGLCLGVLRFGRRFPFAVTGWFWFLGMLVPTIGIVQVSNQAMADRYTYLPSIGVFIIFVWGAAEALARWRLSKAVVGTGAGLVIVVCVALTEGQLRHWQDSESLFSHALAVTKNNAVAHNNLGNLFLEDGQVDEAMTHYQEALGIQPDYADARCNIGSALLQKGRVDEAIAQFRKALEIQPDDASAHNNLGNALLSAGRFDEAISQYQEALKIQPDFAKAHNNLGWSLVQSRRLDEAIDQFQKALEIQPDYAEAHNNLAFALLQKGQVREAVAHCRTALKLQPGDAGTMSNLAWVLATCPDASVRNGGQAIVLAQRATEITGSQDPMILRTLAAACAEGKRFTDAMAAARRAIQLAENQSNTALADALRSQLVFYEAGTAFRDTSLTDGAASREPVKSTHP
jgi:tetratricopeptide (TPR) repeat protein